MTLHMQTFAGGSNFLDPQSHCIMDESRRSPGFLGDAVMPLLSPSRGADRSRSPLRSGSFPWSVGDHEMDLKFRDFNIEPQYLQDFAALDFMDRKRIMNNMLRLAKSGDLGNPTGYLIKCVDGTPASARHRIVRKGGVHTPPHRTTAPGSSPSPLPRSVPTAAASSSPAAPAIMVQSMNAASCPEFMTTLASKKMDPNDFVDTFAGMLDSNSRAWYDQLPGMEKVGVVFSYLLTFKGENGVLQQWLKEVMHRHASLFTGSVQHFRHFGSAAPTVSLQPILAGMSVPAAVAVAAALVSQKQVQLGSSVHQVTWHTPVIFNEIHQQQVLSIEECSAAFGVTVTGIKSANALLQQVQENKANLLEHNVRFVMLTVCAPKPGNGEQLVMPGVETILHGLNGYSFEILRFVDGVRKLLGDRYICEACMVQEQDAGSHIATIWGERVHMENWDTRFDVRPPPAVYAVPSNMQIVSLGPDAGLHDSAIRGQPRGAVDECPGLGKGQCIRPSGLDKFTNCASFGFPREQKELACLRLLKTSIGCPPVMSLPSRYWWIQWFALNPQKTAELYDARVPCLGYIKTYSGLSAEASSGMNQEGNSVCGAIRYCRNCAQIFRDLDHGFVELSMLSTVWAQVTNCAAEWLAVHRPEEPLNWGRPDSAMRMHVCNSNCPAWDSVSSAGSNSSQM